MLNHTQHHQAVRRQRDEEEPSSTANDNTSFYSFVFSRSLFNMTRYLAGHPPLSPDAPLSQHNAMPPKQR